MIFVSENGITDASRQEAWDVWYLKHLSVMTSVKGVDSAQRFKTTAAGRPPSFAMYTIATPDVFKDPYYLSIRGLDEFESVRDLRLARRNLFAGLDVAPVVAKEQRLLVLDRSERTEIHGIAFDWLAAAGLDGTTPLRGIALVDASTAERVGKEHGIPVYVPVTGVYRNGVGAPY